MSRYQALLSKSTLEKIKKYQSFLQGGETQGNYFNQNLEGFNSRELTNAAFLEILVNTKRPQIYAETAVYGDGSDWNQQELSILGDISIAVPVTIYDNGRHSNPDVLDPPFRGTLLFVPGALLANGRGAEPADWEEVTEDGQIDSEGLYRLYERRLLPPLLYANDKAEKMVRSALITLPGIGCGYFSGLFHHQLGEELKHSLIRLLETHKERLPHIKAVYFDPYRECKNERHQIGHISFFIRPLTKENEAKPQLCRPERYEEEGDDFSNCELFSIVAWDHVSWPGNDFYSGLRQSDDGVKAAATNSMQAMTGVEGFCDPDVHKYLPPKPYHTWKQVVNEGGMRIKVEGNLSVY